MKAEIICVGTELLLGDIVNTNARFIARELSAIGLNVYNQQVVGDNPERLRRAAQLAKDRSDIVIYTGGLGPTEDDLTKQTVARVYNDSLVFNEKIQESIAEYFAKTGRQMTENNKRQAYVPKNGRFLENHNGTAPGIIFLDGEKMAILLPGVPKEAEPMFKNQVVPMLKRLETGVIISKYIRTIGIGESRLEEKLAFMIKGKNPTVALYAKDGEVLVRITASAKDKAAAEEMLDSAYKSIDSAVHNYIYGVDVDNIETALVRKLQKEGKILATAESCTGGNLSARITSVSGASEVFSLGVCTYTNQQKNKVLGVKKRDLENYSAVSSPVAMSMAQNALRISGADYAVATTGYAGPGGGTPQDPVGTVYIAVATKDTVFVKRCFFQGNREKVTHLACQSAFDLLRCVLYNIPNPGARAYYNEPEEEEEEKPRQKKSVGFLRGFAITILLIILACCLAFGRYYYKNGKMPDFSFKSVTRQTVGMVKGLFDKDIDIARTMEKRQSTDFFRRGFEQKTVKMLSRLTAQNPDVKGWLTFKMSKKEFAIADKDLSAEGVALYTDNSGKAENCLYVYGFTPENSFDFTDIETLRQNSSFVFFEDGGYTDCQIFSVGTFSRRDLENLKTIDNKQEFIVQALARSLFDVDIAITDNMKIYILLQEIENGEYVAVFAVKGNRNTYPSVDVKTMALYADWYMSEKNLTDEFFFDAVMYAQEVYDRNNWSGLNYDNINNIGEHATPAPIIPSSSANIRSNEGANSSSYRSSSNKGNSSKPNTPSSNGQNSTANSQTPSEENNTPKPTRAPAPETPSNPGEEVLTVTMNGSVVSGTATQILSQIVAIEMTSNWNREALKAQAVATHSWLEFQYAQGNSAPAVNGRSSPSQSVVNAVSQVANVVMQYNGSYVNAVYTASAAGYTNPASQVWGQNYAYLQTVESKYDYLASNYEKTYTISAEKMKEIIEQSVSVNLDLENAANWFSVADYTDGGYIRRLHIGDATTYVASNGNTRNITGYWFVNDIMAKGGVYLRSHAMDISYADGNFTILTRGYGHGVGLSQWGAQLYASYEGWNYQQILSHYYSGVTFTAK